MARSQIIKEFAKNQIDLESMLRQLKLLLIDLGKDELVDWTKHELEGYPSEVELPNYRIFNGVLKGSFLNFNLQCNNVPIPLKRDTPDDVIDFTSNVYLREGISALKALDSDKGGSIYMPIPGNYLPAIQHHAAVTMTYLTSANIEASSTVVKSVLASVENKIMDILILLESEFGCIDNLELDISSLEKSELEKVQADISFIVFDNHVEVGDNNTIKNSTLNG